MLRVSNLYTEYPGDKGQVVKATFDISFEVPRGKLFTLLGPSGCGKTTTLRSIAGLERPSAGEIAVDGVVVFSGEKGIFVPPNRRNFGMVFQSYAIWPHMNVFQNAAFPLESGVRRHGRKEVEEKVMRVLTAVGLEEFADRPATKMSGGQQQRLALARALVMEPKLLLLDEPLSNLDAKLRQKMRFELKRMQRELDLTTIYVTHDQSEALALSHEIAVMNAGRIVQVGSPRDIYERPRDSFVADFVGVSNFLRATVLEPDPAGGYQVQSEIGRLRVSACDPLVRGQEVLLSVRPEEVELSAHPVEAENVIPGKVDAKVFLGESTDYQIRAGGREVLARAHPSFNVLAGTQIYLRIRPEKCITIVDRQAYKQAA
ncbi:Fe3+/spermidine/putrescine ABC transporter ATP-binding protein [Pigmentiphaga sp. NML080357]|uniref:ABC transporter ATP-binding protein n=1 Tax=Pigmentiphaga sp. NML080357 TaxID=2008675 RepID=UPI000B409667|nr:ABC transporter ATP-binding protein [Pigmentiphaga sp. NML080357]OVZ61263.1 Fe3+/spermidine/putrescine ABC transporter ATP-binding protein [Pigmentiphaga sp. NML080357]